MVEFSNNATQTVALNGSAVFTDRPAGGCSCGITHREGSGLITLRGRGRYLVLFGGNIAVAEGGTVGPISLAIAIDGEPLGTSTAVVTPAAIGDQFHVFTAAVVSVPCDCCVSVSVRNTSTGTAIDVANANLIIERAC